MKKRHRSGKRTTRIGLSVLLVAAMAAFAVGCSRASGDSAGRTTKPSQPASAAPGQNYDRNEKAELTIWMTQVGTYKPGQKPGEWVKDDLVPEWNKVFPNVKVNVEIIPFDLVNEKITTAIASRTTPDILMDYPGRTLAYGQMGALLKLDDILPPTDLVQIHKNLDIMKMVSVKGDIVTMPYYATQVALLLNRSLWKEAGAENLLPQNPDRTWTPEQFKAALKAVANKEKGVYGLTLFALNEQGDQLYNNLLVSFGAKLFNDDYSKFTAADSPGSEQALAFLKSLVDEGLVNPHPETLTSVNALDLWRQRKNGMIVANATHSDLIVNGLKDGSVAAPHEYMYVNFPSTTPGKSALKTEIGFGVAFKTGNATREKWAKKFLYWSMNENTIFAGATKTFNPLGNEPAWVVSDPELRFLAKLSMKTKEWPVVDSGWGIKGYPEMRAAMFPEMQRLFIGQTTPKQAIANISAKTNDVIAKYKK
ncbi:extracellular solute-binding protein [Paenibacillus cymbidii]|uniref:extracellular solute-binding protein n=1 Tax=Paenibacillus cymbidii TaxID=1639034 RepID=UPI0010815F39|nr:extracellular solute-binding protein [Paenibacillus cymbidii]